MKWLKRKVVMLPTEKAPLALYNNTMYVVRPNKDYANCVFYNLYFLSDDKINEGDWFLSTFNSYPLHNVKGGFVEYPDTKGCKKIIATTDKSLFNHQKETPSLPERIFYLPEPSKDFLEIYVNAYNQGKQIDDVLVAYIELLSDLIIGKREKALYIKKDNTVSIRKAVEKTYSRAEVEKLLNACWNAGYDQAMTLEWEGICDISKEDWIKQVL